MYDEPGRGEETREKKREHLRGGERVFKDNIKKISSRKFEIVRGDTEDRRGI